MKYLVIAGLATLVLISGTYAVKSFNTFDLERIVRTTRNTKPSSPAPTHSSVRIPSATSTPSTAVRESGTDTSPMNTWRYPASTVVHQTSSTAEYLSTDPANTITQWYASRLSDRNFSNNSTITTSTNGSIQNVLSATSYGESISIRISSDAGSQNVSISINTSE